MHKVLAGTESEHAERSAAGMIAAHGGAAESVCRSQIEKMRRRKDVAGEEIWRTVLEHILRQRESS